jgi:uncharacterized Ntn-hydrolase superfamily protein
VTYSIAAADQTTHEVGAAGTSCLSGQDVYVIYTALPGRGVLLAQARYSVAAKQRAAELLGSGDTPADIIAAITQTSFDAGSAERQYGIVDVTGAAAGFTGNAAMPYAEDRQGTVGSLSYSVQGNILTSAKVLDQAASAFQAGGCDLPERLMSALEAGAAGGEGDNRCTPDGIPADSAFLQVEAPSGSPGGYLALRVQSSGNEDPLPLLRAQLEDWRGGHPCPTPMQPSDPIGGSGGIAGGSGTAGTATAPANNDEPEGCGCRLAVRETDFAPWLLLGSLLVVALGRRRAAR